MYEPVSTCLNLSVCLNLYEPCTRVQTSIRYINNRKGDMFLDDWGESGRFHGDAVNIYPVKDA